MSPPPAKRPRQAISHSQRKALRAWYRDSATSSKKTLADASVWWNSQYGYILNSTTASDILSSKYAFLDNNDSAKAANTKRDRGPKWEVLEAALADWALRFDAVHGTVSGDLLRLKATEFWSKLPQYQGQVCPSWSDGWLEGFKKRHNFRQRRKVGEAGSVQITEEMSAQMERIRAVQSQFLPQDTYNMDETGFHWKRLPSSGLTASSIGKKLDKARITANLCCNQDGSDKVPLWFIGNAKSPRCFARNHIKNPENIGIFWRWNSAAWMNHYIMLEWLRWFDKRAGRPVLLLMDNFSAHELAVQLIKESDQPLKWTQTEWFPANTTSVFQPLDQGIIQNWKCFVRRELLLFLKAEFDAGRDFIKTHHVLRAIRWGVKAWEAVDITTITRCWEKGLKIQPGEHSWQESTELLQEIQAEVNSLVNTVVDGHMIQEIMNITDFINPKDEAIVDSTEDLVDIIVAQYQEEEEDQDDEGQDEVVACQVTVSEAIAALETLKLYQEQKDGPVEQNLMAQLKRELRELEATRVNSVVQSTLAGWLQRRA